ncbi:MAG: M20/M25/M40 family metallo-hydrolase [Pirellulales bacterium]|nr:M20/M25/M40 family metallo-hydrolase [Pirellulales bacterium]
MRHLLSLSLAIVVSGIASWSLAAESAETTAARAKAYAAALDSVTVDEVRTHIDRLADDTFEGREAGSRGGHAAGNYLRERFEKAGIAGGAAKGGYFQVFGNGYRNVLGLLEGSDPELKHEVIVVGAHYDHVGYGTPSNSYGPTGFIHNGADDNASGTSGLLEVIDAFGKLEPRPRRSILFAFWDGEEKGLLGSEHWAGNPTIALARVKAAINMDMIGRLRAKGLEVSGIRTGAGYRQFISRGNAGAGVKVDFNWENADNSDHHSFFKRNIPYLMLHTGLHDDYHRPSDDAEKINAEGVQQISKLMVGTLGAMADADALPPFRAQSRQETVSLQRNLDRPLPPLVGRFGVVWDPDDKSASGVRVTRVVPGSPAAKAGIKVGDRIVGFDGKPLVEGVDLRSLVIASKSPTQAVIEREGEEKPLELPVELAGSPLRLGVTWRVDDAEPGCVILSRVVPGSPADLAGLQVNDRIHEFGGRTFLTSKDFAALASSLEGSLDLVVERNGQLRGATVELPALEVAAATLDETPIANAAEVPAAADAPLPTPEFVP